MSAVEVGEVRLFCGEVVDITTEEGTVLVELDECGNLRIVIPSEHVGSVQVFREGPVIVRAS